jgi:hypothetical protein
LICEKAHLADGPRRRIGSGADHAGGYEAEQNAGQRDFGRTENRRASQCPLRTSDDLS